MESISHFLLTESFKSSKLSDFFMEHGGVNKEYYQKSLGDISDEQIMLFDVFESYNDAMDEKHRLIYKTRSDHHHRSQYDMACLFEIYVANDGYAALVGIDRDSIETSMTWGGEKEKKVADRFWRKQSFSPYKDSDEYHYSRKGYGPDFGLHTSGDYKRNLGNLKDKSNLFDKEGYNFKDWRNDELERMQGYIRRHPKYDGRDDAREKIMRNINK